MDIAGRRDSFLNTTPLCVFLLVIIISASSSKATTNLLLTGETLQKNSKLGYPDSKVSLELRGDCNLVLHNSEGHIVWESGTSHPLIPFPECTVSVTDKGRLVLNGTWFGIPFSWISPNADSKVGKYVAILRHEAELTIHGPAVWSPINGQESISSNNNEIVNFQQSLVYNVLFSGQELHDNDKLTNGEYSFILKKCELILKKSNGEILWRSNTAKNSVCIAKLTYYGQVVIQEFTGYIVWTNGLANLPHGEYALVLHQYGNLNIYGPKVWSTPQAESGLIQMRTAEK